MKRRRILAFESNDAAPLRLPISACERVDNLLSSERAQVPSLEAPDDRVEPRAWRAGREAPTGALGRLSLARDRRHHGFGNLGGGLETLDPTRGQASISFDGAVGAPLTTGGGGSGAVAEALNVALVVLAAEQVGGAAACLDMAVEYAKIRHQFSRPVGSFQAIKHKLADLLLLVEMGRSAVDRAMAAEHDPARLAEAAAVAKIWCSDAYTTVATENVQIHGGIGFTSESDAHRYLKRAHLLSQLGGAASRQRLLKPALSDAERFCCDD